MFFSRLIRWLSGFPAPYALGLLWWLEVTVLMCAIAGGYFLSNFLFENVKARWEYWLFPLAQITYLLVFYIMHFEFTRTSQLMEALMHIHRMGGRELVDHLHKTAIEESDIRTRQDGEHEMDKIPNPFSPPLRIRASAGPFRIRYFIVLPTAAILYLISFASTIYRIFTRQIQSWDPGYVIMPALIAVALSAVCFWLLMPYVPGYVGLRRLLGHKPHEGE